MVRCGAVQGCWVVCLGPDGSRVPALEALWRPDFSKVTRTRVPRLEGRSLGVGCDEGLRGSGELQERTGGGVSPARPEPETGDAFPRGEAAGAAGLVRVGEAARPGRARGAGLWLCRLRGNAAPQARPRGAPVQRILEANALGRGEGLSGFDAPSVITSSLCTPVITRSPPPRFENAALASYFQPLPPCSKYLDL